MENVIASSAAFETLDRTARSLVWTGRILTGLIVAFLLVDAVGKLIPLAPYVEGTKQAGYALELLRPLGLLLAIPTLLHLIPRLWAAYVMRSARLRAFLRTTIQ